MFGKIYKITNKINDKVYIGQTWRPLHDRFSQHKRDGKCLKLSRAINKYGKNNFNISLCVISHTQEVLDYWECFFIKKYNSIKNGYNIREGGSKGKLAESSKLKISKALKGNTNSKNRKLSKTHKKRISKSNKGKIFSKEHKRNLSNSHLKISKEDQKKICELYQDNYSCVDLANKFNCTDGAIRGILKRHNIPSKKMNLKQMEKDICNSYKDTQSIQKVAELFNYSAPTIRKILRKNKIKVSKTKLTKKQEEKIYQKYLNNMSAKQLADKFSCSEWKIRQTIHKINKLHGRL